MNDFNQLNQLYTEEVSKSKPETLEEGMLNSITNAIHSGIQKTKLAHAYNTAENGIENVINFVRGRFKPGSIRENVLKDIRKDVYNIIYHAKPHAFTHYFFKRKLVEELQRCHTLDDFSNVAGKYKLWTLWQQYRKDGGLDEYLK